MPTTVRLKTPTRAYIEDFSSSDLANLRRLLTYTDKRVDFELRKAKKSAHLLHQLGEERYVEHIADLKARRNPCLLNEDGSGIWIHSGLGTKVASHFGTSLVRDYELPERQLLPWAKTPTTPRPYQEKALELLLAATINGPAGIEHGTGLGKTTTAMMAVKHLGLRAVLMCPSKSIARQTFKDFTTYLGAKYVGLYGDGRKDFKKLITIAIDDSLALVEPGSEAWNAFSSAQVFIADESHLTPANTLQRVCLELMANAPYRFFFSGTQLRNDGLDLVLEGIVGQIVHTMTVKEGVDQGYLSRPRFTMVRVPSDTDYESQDANKMTRKHLYYNRNVLAKAADIANKAVLLLKRPTLILVEEVEQFTAILPLLKVKAGFAHGPLTKENRGKVPPAFHESDPAALVEDFDAGNLPILVGTSCISTGTDIKSAAMIVRIKGKTSEIAVRQDTGRGTRLFDGKTDCHIVDFDVFDVDLLHRHADVRRTIYNDIYGPVQEMK
jgi:superfamily II DNA or RNA helicase